MCRSSRRRQLGRRHRIGSVAAMAVRYRSRAGRRLVARPALCRPWAASATATTTRSPRQQLLGLSEHSDPAIAPASPEVSPPARTAIVDQHYQAPEAVGCQVNVAARSQTPFYWPANGLAPAREQSRRPACAAPISRLTTTRPVSMPGPADGGGGEAEIAAHPLLPCLDDSHEELSKRACMAPSVQRPGSSSRRMRSALVLCTPLSTCLDRSTDACDDQTRMPRETCRCYTSSGARGSESPSRASYCPPDLRWSARNTVETNEQVEAMQIA